jgi:HSP20 family molecular chaperone IbpA
MSNLIVEKVHDEATTPAMLFERMTAIAERVRQRAYEIFQGRGCAEGHSLDDWLQAEREIIESPDTELMEKDGNFQIRIAVPGFVPDDVHVTAMPTALFVEAKATHNRSKADGDLYISEFGQKQLFRRVDLPAPVHVEKVSAVVDYGILEVAAPKTVDPANKVKAISAARGLHIARLSRRIALVLVMEGRRRARNETRTTALDRSRIRDVPSVVAHSLGTIGVARRRSIAD